MANGKNWRLKGEYFESCNCEVLCPCIVRGTNIDPTEGHCDVALAFHIVEGDLDGVSLDGLNFIAVNFTPGPMAAGGWTSSFYVDEKRRRRPAGCDGTDPVGRYGRSRRTVAGHDHRFPRGALRCNRLPG